MKKENNIAPVYASNDRKVTEVAVGIIISLDGNYLLAQRMQGKPYEGYWEFPGGKLELGESVEDALERELHEELGIEVRASRRWHTIEHDYPHAYVRLYLCKVDRWSGEPHSKEGQTLAWQRLPVNVAPLLPATVRVLELLEKESMLK